jgi:hypothetical protein
MTISYIGKDCRILVRAFEDALKKLAVDRTHSKALIVAEYIITFAKSGERDPVRLCDLTVRAIGGRRLIVRGRSVHRRD